MNERNKEKFKKLKQYPGFDELEFTHLVRYEIISSHPFLAFLFGANFLSRYYSNKARRKYYRLLWFRQMENKNLILNSRR